MVKQGRLNLDALLKHVFTGLRQAIHVETGFSRMFRFLAENSARFLRQLRSRSPARAPKLLGKPNNDFSPWSK
jgi:hypothetical protein